MPSDAAPRRAALFVDFDNVFFALLRWDERAAYGFGERPDAWLAWLEGRAEGGAPTDRRTLIRRCYLNPGGFADFAPGRAVARYRATRGFRERVYFGEFRSAFVQAGFDVVDCPPVTSLKNAADMKMALDVREALDHRTVFEEFVLLSGDSDFLPALARLRAHDRRITILAQETAKPAYLAAADTVVGLDEFAHDALGQLPVAQLAMVPAPPVPAVAAPPPRVEPPRAAPPTPREAVFAWLRDQLARSATGALRLTELGQGLTRAFPQLKESKYLGAGSLGALIEEAGDARLALSGPPARRWLFDPDRGPAPRDLPAGVEDQPALNGNGAAADDLAAEVNPAARPAAPEDAPAPPVAGVPAVPADAGAAAGAVDADAAAVPADADAAAVPPGAGVAAVPAGAGVAAVPADAAWRGPAAPGDATPGEATPGEATEDVADPPALAGPAPAEDAEAARQEDQPGASAGEGGATIADPEPAPATTHAAPAEAPPAPWAESMAGAPASAPGGEAPVLLDRPAVPRAVEPPPPPGPDQQARAIHLVRELLWGSRDARRFAQELPGFAPGEVAPLLAAIARRQPFDLSAEAAAISAAVAAEAAAAGVPVSAREVSALLRWLSRGAARLAEPAAEDGAAQLARVLQGALLAALHLLGKKLTEPQKDALRAWTLPAGR